MRVIICGGRNFSDSDAFLSALAKVQIERGPISRVIEGGASGADRLAKQWAISTRVPKTTVNADWKTHGRAAGPIRNSEMLNLNPDLVIAFAGGRGTANMIKQAKASGVEVVEIESQTRGGVMSDENRRTN